MSTATGPECFLHPQTIQFYRNVMLTLSEHNVPFLIGGSYALVNHTQMPRRTKDLDLFLLRSDMPRALRILAATGYRSELTFSHWLGKVFYDDDFVDMIFNSGNGLCPVDESWFDHALEGVVLGMPARLCPLEESIWQKAFIMERHRYDGADVAHLLRAGGEDLDWPRLLARFGDHWHVLLSHLILYGFIYPTDAELIPSWVRIELTQRYLAQGPGDRAKSGICGGTYLSSIQYRGDLEQGGFRDGRLAPHGNMTSRQLDRWMASFDEPEPTDRQCEPSSD